MAERKYSFKQMKERFGVSGYELEKMMERGELEPELPRVNPSESRYWTESQVLRCDRKLYEKSLPPVPVKNSTFRFSKKTEAAIRAAALRS